MESITVNADFLKRQTGLLVDPLRCPKKVAQTLSTMPICSIAPTAFASQAAQLPSLIDLKECTRAQRIELLELMLAPDTVEPESFPFVSVCETGDVGYSGLVAHFRRLLSPNLPNSERGLFLYYDPQVWVHLQWMLTLDQKRAFMGPVYVWTLPLKGTWRSAVLEKRSKRKHFSLPAAQWRRIERIGSMNAVLADLPNQSADVADQAALVESLLVRAERHGLTDSNDRIVFAETGITRHQAFDSHARIRNILEESKGHPARFRRRIVQLSDTDWRKLIADLKEADRGPRDTRLRPVASAKIAQELGAEHE